MSDALYATRLRWTGGRGIAQLHGERVTLLKAPVLSTIGAVDSLDYVPEVGVVMVMPKWQGWRDMTSDEIKECDAILRQLVGG